MLEGRNFRGPGSIWARIGNYRDSTFDSNIFAVSILTTEVIYLPATRLDQAPGLAHNAPRKDHRNSVNNMAQYIYTMIGVSKVVPPNRTIIKDISLSFFPGAKIGLLGLNGAGKSTVLRIMAGADPDFEGEARPQDGIRIGYLPQEPELDDSKSVRQVVEEGVAEVRGLLTRFDEISMKFAEPMSDDAMNELLAEQADLQEAIELANGWELERTLELAADALRLPEWDASVAVSYTHLTLPTTLNSW